MKRSRISTTFSILKFLLLLLSILDFRCLVTVRNCIRLTDTYVRWLYEMLFRILHAFPEVSQSTTVIQTSNIFFSDSKLKRFVFDFCYKSFCYFVSPFIVILCSRMHSALQTEHIRLAEAHTKQHLLFSRNAYNYGWIVEIDRKFTSTKIKMSHILQVLWRFE